VYPNKTEKGTATQTQFDNFITSKKADLIQQELKLWKI
jgi:hypothetical protein